MDVLVVEKDASELSYLVELIKQLGHSVDQSETGRGALERVTERMFDLVILDIPILDIATQDLIAGFKELYPEIGIVTMTESNSTDLEKEIRSMGIIYYMVKPIEGNVLKDILDHISKRITTK